MAEPTVILLTHVEDERAIYGDSLRASGFRVHLASDPDHALDLIARLHADVLVTRIQQPGQSKTGLDLLRAVKQLPPPRRIPVVIITSMMQLDLRRIAHEAGCDGYLLLPSLPDALVAEVARVLNLSAAGSPESAECLERPFVFDQDVPPAKMRSE